jgi:putative component of toxin-antitoxin plasmid stabilization module
MGYALPMIEIRKTDVFVEWLEGLRDIRARARVLVRIERPAPRLQPVGAQP